jgi:hypothetical protein
MSGLVKTPSVAALVTVAVFSTVSVFSGAYVGAASPMPYPMIPTWTPPALSPVPLPPNEQGYVRVEVNSGSTGCSVNTELVACETASSNWRSADGRPHHTVSMTADGELHWPEGDLGALAGRVTLDDTTYSAQGWDIVVTPNDTTFTHHRSGHGMTVSDQSMAPF